MEHTTKAGLFITIEGAEGVGKSTAVTFIQNFLADRIACVFTREPGGTGVAEKIREILLTPNAAETMAEETELLLMFAGRAQHLQSCIIPALEQNKWVICDRFIDATYAYQGYGRGMSLDKIALLDEWIVGKYKPDLTILLDAPVELGLARAKHRGPQDRIEQEKIDFFERVRTGYLERAKAAPARFVIIDAVQPLERVHENIKAVLEQAIASVDRY